MHDQADSLRKLVRRRARRPASADRPKLIVVAGGKGGVGTTTICVNLAVALSARRHRSVLVDAVLDRSDVAHACDCRPCWSMADVLSRRRPLLETIIAGPAGVGIVAAGSCETESLTIQEAPCDVVDEILDLGGRADFVCIDVGDRRGASARTFWHAADLVLLVTSLDPLAVYDAYAVLKTMATDHPHIEVATVVNMGRQPDESRRVHERLADASNRFLGRPIRGVARIPFDPLAEMATQRRQPVVLAAPESPAAVALGELARHVASRTHTPAEAGIAHPVPRTPASTRRHASSTG